MKWLQSLILGAYMAFLLAVGLHFVSRMSRDWHALETVDRQLTAHVQSPVSLPLPVTPDALATQANLLAEEAKREDEQAKRIEQEIQQWENLGHQTVSIIDPGPAPSWIWSPLERVRWEAKSAAHAEAVPWGMRLDGMTRAYDRHLRLAASLHQQSRALLENHRKDFLQARAEAEQACQDIQHLTEEIREGWTSPEGLRFLPLAQHALRVQLEERRHGLWLTVALHSLGCLIVFALIFRVTLRLFLIQRSFHPILYHTAST